MYNGWDIAQSDKCNRNCLNRIVSHETYLAFCTSPYRGSTNTTCSLINEEAKQRIDKDSLTQSQPKDMRDRFMESLGK